MKIPKDVLDALQALERHGFEAYVVGGCVRDSLIGLTPKDWDIATSAMPEQTIACLSGARILQTGVKHGTVTLLTAQGPVEITSYRKDGAYSDGRRPDTVTFIPELEQDLLRRDFTVNAMAYHPQRGLVDLCGGEEDLRAGLLRCVGKAEKRFGEDALRILRALRFASTYGFTMEASTARAVFSCAPLLARIAPERTREELKRLLCGKAVEKVLIRYVNVLAVSIPELEATIGYAQNSPYQHLDVWAHTVRSIALAPPQFDVRLALLLHDLAKPACYKQDERGMGHFYGHPQLGASMARRILLRLRFDLKTVEMTHNLVLYHGVELAPGSRNAKRWLHRLGEACYRRLIAVKRADILAQSDFRRQERLAALEGAEASMERVLEEKQCYALNTLRVNGNDLINLGIPQSRKIGRILNSLVSQVIEEQIENEPEALLAAAKRMAEE